jgi:hypothetical protein
VLFVAGTPARRAASNLAPDRPPAACGGDAQVVTRPLAVPDVSPIPPVTVKESVDIASRLSPERATQIVRDVVTDLAIAAEALRRRSPALAAAAASGPFLDRLTATICSSATTVVVPGYTLDHAEVGLRRRAKGQRAPEIEVHVRGRVQLRTYTTSPPTNKVTARDVPYRETFIAVFRSGNFLVCAFATDADAPRRCRQ